jgi:hypothetical protein
VYSEIVLEIWSQLNEDYNSVPNGNDTLGKGWILDGFPRTVDEANFLVQQGIVPDFIVELEDGK